MKQQRLWRVSLWTSAALEDFALAAIQDTFQLPAVSWHDFERQRCVIEVYPPRTISKVELRQHLKDVAVRVTRQLAALEVASGVRCEIRPLANKDWAESWKRHFKPLRIGKRLLLLPSWLRSRRRRGEVTVNLDPGLSFGTGQHPTTRFCLEEIVRAQSRFGASSLLDAGCGSGILALAAAKLGYQRVDAFDFDPVAVQVAKVNARRNRVDHRLTIVQRDVAKLRLRPRANYDLVCANLIANVLVENATRIVAQVEPQGWLVLAGILRQEFQQVTDVFQGLGFSCVRSETQKEWRSGTFRRAAGGQNPP